MSEELYPTNFPTDPVERAAIEAEAKRLFGPTLLDTTSTLTCDWPTCMQVARVVMAERDALKLDISFSHQHLDQLKERHSFGIPNSRSGNLRNRVQWAISDMEQELSKLRSRTDDLKIGYEADLATLRSQLDAIKAEVVRKDGALRAAEYCGTWDGRRRDTFFCPVCQQAKGTGHADDCDLGLALTPTKDGR